MCVTCARVCVCSFNAIEFYGHRIRRLSYTHVGSSVWIIHIYTYTCTRSNYVLNFITRAKSVQTICARVCFGEERLTS